jgi:hypothetical protein
MKPELIQLDPVAIYLDYLIRQSLPKNAPLSPKDIILSRVLSGPLVEKYPNTMVIEHRQTRPFSELVGRPNKGEEISDRLFKSTLSTRNHLSTRGIQADVTNTAGWYYGRPILLTIATIVDADEHAIEKAVQGEAMNFIMTNTYLGDTYKTSPEGMVVLPELESLLEAHAAQIFAERLKSPPGYNSAVA